MASPERNRTSMVKFNLPKKDVKLNLPTWFQNVANEINKPLDTPNLNYRMSTDVNSIALAYQRPAFKKCTKSNLNEAKNLKPIKVDSNLYSRASVLQKMKRKEVRLSNKNGDLLSDLPEEKF